MSGPAARIAFRAGIGGEPITQERHSSAGHGLIPSAFGAWLAASPARLVAGTHTALRIGVGVGCCAEIRSSSPSGAQPPPPDPCAISPGCPSSEAVQVTVASDAMFIWAVEPSVAAAGCNHLSDSAIQLAGNARLMWRHDFQIDPREERHPGTWRTRLRVTRDGWPVVCSDLAVGPRSALWHSPAVLDAARAVSTLVVVDPEQPGERWGATRAGFASALGVALPLPAPGLQILAWGDDPDDCRSLVEQMMRPSGVPGWVQSRWRGAPGPLEVTASVSIAGN